MEKSKLKELLIEKHSAAPLPKSKSLIAREKRAEVRSLCHLTIPSVGSLHFDYMFVLFHQA